MKLYIAVSILILSLAACNKQDEWLDEKRNKSDVTPGSVSDFQAVMDNDFMYSSYLAIALMGADNFYVASSDLAGIPIYQRNSYLWNSDIFENTTDDGGYLNLYTVVAYSNIVLDGIGKIDVNDENRNSIDNIKGQALFYRSYMFYNLMNLFSLPFDSSSAANNLAIPLRLTSDINKIYTRATAKQVYDQIVSDLVMAADLLPVNAEFKTRPSRLTAYALLSKTYLILKNYTKAREYADLVLNNYNTLLDFNSGVVTTSKTYRFPDYATGNPEVLLYGNGGGGSIVTPSTLGLGYVDSVLYTSYDVNDLRLTYFYANISGNKARFRGGYTGNNQVFHGIAVNEIYLIRAECNARLGNTAPALADLNKLLRNRYKTGFYTDFTTTNAETALYKILEERRKELPFYAQVRWEDLRRLNNDSRFEKTLVRAYNNTTYTLQPNSRKYAYPFSLKEVQLSGVEQNER